MARITLVFSSLLVLVACKKDDPPPAQPVQPVYTAQPSATVPAASATVIPGQMSVPGPSALACNSDADCLTHRCNLQYKKCSFPCRSDADCLQGTTCVVGAGELAYCWAKPAGQ